jgi:O-methyltransferase
MIKSLWKSYTKTVKSFVAVNFDIVLSKIVMSLDKKNNKFIFEDGYIKNASMVLIANEIYDKNIIGNVAELGVYRGDFAKNINKAFP